jgi:UDP-N-acetyl-D-mannosaminuronate dehydrogenase
VLGVSFKPNIQDARNSPSADVIAQLAARGADLRYHDPLIDTFRDASGDTHHGRSLDELLGWADVIVVLVKHRAIDWDRVYGEAPLVVDAVDSSRGRGVGERQVLRLGAGWAAAKPRSVAPAEGPG